MNEHGFEYLFISTLHEWQEIKYNSSTQDKISLKEVPMYKIFIVEDELLIRQSIRNMVENLTGSYMLVGEAADGEIALSMMQDLMPDILLTDLKMPFLDGFGLIRHVKSIIPWIKIIIISGYDEFESAQKAISLGVDLYLLKPIAHSTLAEAIDKVAKQLDESKQQSLLPGGYNEDELQYALHQHYMQQLLFGSTNTGDLLERAHTLELDVIHTLYQVVLFNFDISKERHENFHGRILSILSDQNISLYFFNGTDQLTLVLCGDNNDTLNEETYRFINIARHEFTELGIVTTVVGNMVERISAIKDACAAASAMMKKVHSVSAGEIIDINDTAQVAVDIISFSGVFDEELYQKLLQAVPDDIPALMETYWNGKDSNKFDSMLYRYYALVDILKAAVQMVGTSKPGADGKDIAVRLSANYDIFSASASREIFEQQSVELLKEAINIRNENTGLQKHGHVISRAKEYVKENYCDPNISLISTAKNVGMSPAHFSTIFAQTVGTSFINYLTAMRIGRAKELLAVTDTKLSAIAMDIGYNEPNYFSHVFKKLEGITPKEYRNKFH
jgi:two-component system response regulator YesN